MSESVGVGPCTPVASGRVVRSAEPFGTCAGRMVRTDDVLSMADWGTERMTVVLYSECTLDVLSKSGCALLSLSSTNVTVSVPLRGKEHQIRTA